MSSEKKSPSIKDEVPVSTKTTPADISDAIKENMMSAGRSSKDTTADFAVII